VPEVTRSPAVHCCPPIERTATLGEVTDILQVTTATPDRESAIALAEAAVNGKFAAGAQIIGPIASAFWHDGQFGTGEEYQLILKTPQARYPALERFLVENHPWQNPEITAVSIAAAPTRYQEWARAVTATD
jgi:periplasmic divalent cation tolerance protein